MLGVSVQSPAFRQPALFCFSFLARPVQRKPVARSSCRWVTGSQSGAAAGGAAVWRLPGREGGVGTERIQVGGRSLTAKGYRRQLQGDAWECWISLEAPPLGFVRSIKRLCTTTTRLELLRIGCSAPARMEPSARAGDGAAITRP